MLKWETFSDGLWDENKQLPRFDRIKIVDRHFLYSCTFIRSPMDK